MSKKKILITGASGFIGSFLVEKSLESGYEVWAGVRKSSSREYLKDERLNFIDLNFSDKSKLQEQLVIHAEEKGRFDYVIHNAGLTKCLDNSDFDKVNYQYTANLIDAFQPEACRPEKFILMSSLSIFGPGDETGYTPIKLSDTPRPNTAYGKSKLKGEGYLQANASFPYVIIRPTGVYGPRDKDYYLMLKTVKSGIDLGAGFKTQKLTFIYVKDLVDAVFLCIEKPIENKAYFVADGGVYTDKEYTCLVKEGLGKKYTVSIKIPLLLLKVISTFAEYLSHITKKPSTLNRDKYKIMKQRNWVCDIQPLVVDIGFRPKYDLKKGLEESVRWYKENGWL